MHICINVVLQHSVKKSLFELLNKRKFQNVNIFEVDLSNNETINVAQMNI